jgi:hypothetical protein
VGRGAEVYQCQGFARVLNNYELPTTTNISFPSSPPEGAMADKTTSPTDEILKKPLYGMKTLHTAAKIDL